MHIDMDFAHGNTFICPVCGKECTVYDTEIKTWRYLNFFLYVVTYMPECSESDVTGMKSRL